MQELTELRSLHSKTYDLGDGRRQTVVQKGQHYHDRDTGAFEEYQAAVETDPFPTGFSHRFKGQHWSRFSAGGQWRIGLGQGLSLTYTPLEASAVEPVVDAGKVGYPDLWPDVDLSLLVFPEGVKESLTLRSGTKSAYSFTLSRQGVTLEASGDTIDVLDETGALVGRITPPTAVDAAGAAGQVTTSLAEDVLTLSLDPAWLADPSRVFPVIIDPTTLVLQPDDNTGKDTWINSSSPDASYETNDLLQVGDGDIARTLIEPDLSTIPAGAGIQSATLELTHVSPTANVSTFRFHRVLESWLETVTWNTAPDFVTTGVDEYTGHASPALNSIDVTQTLRAVHAGANYGVLLKATMADVNNYEQFYSSHYSTASSRPKLTVVWTAAPEVTVTSPNGTQVAPTIINDDMTPDLVGDYTSTTDNVAMTERQHQVLDEDGNVIWDSGVVAEAADPGDAVTVTVPAGYLKYGELYQWRWMSWDANGGYSTWSSAGWFQCDLTAPAGLAATADNTNGHVDLAWTAHAGENLAGYVVERSIHDAGAWTQLNLLLTTTNSYVDDAVASGQAYDYRVSARATDSFTSDPSTSADDTTVSWAQTAWFLGSLKLDDVVTGLGFDQPFNASFKEVLGAKFPSVQTVTDNAGESGRELTLGIETDDQDMYDDIMTEIRKGTISLRSPAHTGEVGRVYRVHVSGRVRAQKYAGRAKEQLAMTIPFREVA